MRKLLLIMLFVSSLNLFGQEYCLTKPFIATETVNQCDTNSWQLVFEDNFSGDSIDLSKWWFGRPIRYCNNEQQYYTQGDNVTVSNGTIKLIARRDTLLRKAVNWLPNDEILFCGDSDRGKNKRYFYYTSANIKTIENFTYGKFEARIKVPKGKGLWTAFWLYGGDPVHNEIDVFEFWNERNFLNFYAPSKLQKVHNMTHHFDHDSDKNTSMCHTKYSSIDFSKEFHVFTLIWEKNKTEWYVDGELKRTDYKYYTELGDPVDCTIYKDKKYLENEIYARNPMHIDLNFAIQSGKDAPVKSAHFPCEMEIDWVRYYKRTKTNKLKAIEKAPKENIID